MHGRPIVKSLKQPGIAHFSSKIETKCPRYKVYQHATPATFNALCSLSSFGNSGNCSLYRPEDGIGSK